ncbi:MAG: ATP-binding protein [Patescibacteria group bacterium]|nr:ATP-binding protein [Patescibacteria group bacterium]
MTIIWLLLIIVSLVLVGGMLFYLYRRSKYWKKQVERSLKMVPFLVTIPRDSGSKDEQARSRDQRDILKEVISVAETFYANLSAVGGGSKIKKKLMGSPHFAAEIVAKDREIFFYLVAPYRFKEILQNGISSQYPDASIEEVEEHNIFNQQWGIDCIAGGELRSKRGYYYPFKTYQEMDTEPLKNITNSLAKLAEGEGAAIQIIFRPADSKYMKRSYKVAKQMHSGDKNKQNLASEMYNLAMAKEKEQKQQQEMTKLTPMEEERIKAIERKAAKPSFETIIRLIASTSSKVRSEAVIGEISSSFIQFSDQSINSFKFKKAKNTEELVSDYIFRFFMKRIFRFTNSVWKKPSYDLILNTEELATIYHLPNFLVDTPGIRWLPSKKAAPPTFIPEKGVVIGYSQFRGENKAIRIAETERRRHVYIVGQTGTGKTTTMINMFLSDIREGKGGCYIDPHGQDMEEHILPNIPKERAEDVIYFDASDTERPLGLNLFSAKTQEQKDFVIQESIAMLYRLYDPGHTGIMGPRFEHWFRNAALALMADPTGGTFIDVPKIFTDDKFLAEKLKYVTDPVVRNFWINEMGQTSDYHKSEMLGWFVGKFGAFMTNMTMRNIIGQVESSLNFRQIMDDKKILLINLAKGQVGEENMKLLGMICVAQMFMGAMSRVDTPENQRCDFYLYVDEFQNFATDTFEKILSEARKFKLNLIVGNQYIGQLAEPIRDSVFGNVGNLVSFRVGNEDAEYLAKQFSPVFNQQDLINLENYHSVAKILIDAKPTRAFSMRGYNYPPGASKEVGDAIKQLARLKYGRPKEIVDEEIQSRMSLNNPMPPIDNSSIPREL